MKDESLPSEHLLDILQGYSILPCLNTEFYFKHFSVIDLLRLEGSEKKDIEESAKSGIKKEKDLLDRAIELDSWSVKKEEELESTRWMLRRSESALNKIEDPTQRKIFNQQIEGQRESLKKIQKERAKITSYSAEHLAQNKKLKKMVKASLFSDLDFTQEPKEEELLPLTPLLLVKFGELNNRDNILKASFFGGFFDIYAAQAANPLDLFKVDYKDLTCFQKSIIVLSNSLLNKLKNVSIPKEISGDPVKIFEYEESEDSEKKTSHGLEDLKRKKQARGGKLKAEDFLS